MLHKNIFNKLNYNAGVGLLNVYFIKLIIL